MLPLCRLCHNPEGLAALPQDPKPLHVFTNRSQKALIVLSLGIQSLNPLLFRHTTLCYNLEDLVALPYGPPITLSSVDTLRADSWSLLQNWRMLTITLFYFQAHHVMSQCGGPGHASPGSEGGARVDGQFRNGLLPVAAGGLDQAPGQPNDLP
jgi:hypothetical protein